MPTQEEIEKRANEIYQRRKADNPFYHDPNADWHDAQKILIEEKRFNYEKWSRG